MRVYNPSSTATVVIHDSAEGFSSQWQAGIRNVVVGPLATVAIPNVDAAGSKSLQMHVANGALQIVDHTEPANATTGNSLAPGMPAGLSLVLALPDVADATVIAIPAGCGIDAVSDYVVSAVGTGAVTITKAVGTVTVAVAAAGTADVLIFKIV
jgi:hypothetical protein